MGFNRRKLEADRKAKADAEAAARRATDSQLLEDAERLVAAWNERQAKRMPMLFLRKRPRLLFIAERGVWSRTAQASAGRSVAALAGV
jgi:hypothetical protein